MKLWGKTQMQLDAERQEMIARREHIARRDQEAKTPAALGQRYSQAMHFGTDIPAPTWQEVEAERARHGRDDTGQSGRIVIWGLVASLACVGLLVIAIAFA